MSDLDTHSGQGKSLVVCGTCPWLKANQGKPHKAGWYTKANLVRLWNALRKGNSPGIVCHSSDPNSGDYGGTGKVAADVERRPCAGAIIQVIKHCNAASAAGSYADYKTTHKMPMSRLGLASWIGRHLFGQLPLVEDRSADIGLKWLEDESPRSDSGAPDNGTRTTPS